MCLVGIIILTFISCLYCGYSLFFMTKEQKLYLLPVLFTQPELKNAFLLQTYVSYFPGYDLVLVLILLILQCAYLKLVMKYTFLTFVSLQTHISHTHCMIASENSSVLCVEKMETGIPQYRLSSYIDIIMYVGYTQARIG